MAKIKDELYDQQALKDKELEVNEPRSPELEENGIAELVGGEMEFYEQGPGRGENGDYSDMD